MIRKSIFGFEWDDNSEWRRLHNEEYRSLYRSSNIARMIKFRTLRWTKHVVRMEESGNYFNNVIGWATGSRPLGKLSSRWEDNIKMDLRETRGTGSFRLRIKMIGYNFNFFNINFQIIFWPIMFKYWIEYCRQSSVCAISIRNPLSAHIILISSW